MSGRKLNTEKNANRGRQNKQRRGTSLEVTEKYTCKLNTFKLQKIKNKEKNTLKEVTGGKNPHFRREEKIYRNYI